MTDMSLDTLRQILTDIAVNGRMAVAYSGGLDSRFLSHAAHMLGFSPVLLHITGPHVPPEETALARSWATGLSLEFREVPVDPLSLPSVAAGTRDRCYACKYAMFTRLTSETSLPLCDGTNASDMQTYRPGLRAVRELGVISPLALAELTKNDIHSLAETTGMALPWQKPRPCLLTRLPYGVSPSRKTLSAIAAGEQVVRDMLAREGLPQVDFRLRLVAPQQTELHVLASDMPALPEALRERLTHAVAAAMPGYFRPVLSPQDTLSGFFDRHIA